MAGWYETLDSTVIHDGWFRLRRDTVRMPDGTSASREVVDHRDAVAVVAVTDDDEVLLVKQYRHAIGRYLLEIPAGVLDVEGEAAEQAARRELREETQHDVERLIRLTTVYTSAGWTNEQVTVFLGQGVTRLEQPVHEPEGEELDLEVVRLPLADAVDAARQGRLTDAKTVIALLHVADRS